jgi:uncharacterized protein (TIGR03067 family)
VTPGDTPPVGQTVSTSLEVFSMIRTSFVLLLASAAVAAPVPKGMKAKPPTMDGKWELVEQNHQNRDEPTFSKWMWVIDGEALSFCRPDGQGVYQPSETNLQATIVPISGGKAGEMDYTLAGNGQPTLYRTLVELDGDELRVCFENTNNAKRPTEVKPDSRILYFRFKRVTEK